MNRSWIAGALAALWIITTTAPSARAETLRVLGATFFVSGMAAKTGGLLLRQDAEKTYDAYLRTAVQQEIQQLRNEANQKRRRGRLLSRTGDGMLVLGALLTAWSLLRSDSQEAPEQPTAAVHWEQAPNGWTIAVQRPF